MDAIREVIAELPIAQNSESGTADTGAVMLTRDELCDRWHISKATLGNYQRAGRIKPTRFGGRRVLYALEDVLTAEARRQGGERWR